MTCSMMKPSQEAPHLGCPSTASGAVEREKSVQQAGVPNIDPGHLHLPLLQVRAPRLKLTHDEGLRQELEVAPYRHVRDTEGPSELGRVPDLALPVGEHPPEAAQGRLRNAAAEGWEVALQKGGDELTTPQIALLVRRGEQGGGKAPSEPEPVDQLRADLVDRDARQVVIGDPPGQTLRALTQQVRRRTSQHKETGGERVAIGEYAKHREQLGAPLHLVQDHDPPQPRQGEPGVVQASQILGILEIEPTNRFRTEAVEH